MTRPADSSPPQSEPLDELTEGLIRQAVYSGCPTGPDVCPYCRSTEAALRNRIRELVEEARREGYQSDKPYFLNRLPKDAYSLELPPDD